MSGPRVTRVVNFLTATEIGESIDAVLARAKKQGVDVALAGGAALQLYGSDRFTKDVDFLASKEVRGFDEVHPLSFGGIRAVTPAGVHVDFIVRNDDYREMYASALRHAIRLPGIPVRVVSPEYMVALKLASGRDKDILDLEFLLMDSEVDVAEAKTVVLRQLGRYARHEIDRYLSDFVYKRSEDNPVRGRSPKGRR